MAKENKEKDQKLLNLDRSERAGIIKTTTESGIQPKATAYNPDDLKGFDYKRDLGDDGD
jgi:hypothetical protein